MKNQKTKFCSKCGESNPSDSNYCCQCEEKLISKKGKLNQVDFTIDKYVDLVQAFNKLIKNKGFLIISINDFYIQFSYNLESPELYCEAVSQNYLPIIRNKTKDFNAINYQLESNGNYYKNIALEDIQIEHIIDEIKNIFTEIYEIQFVNYKIELEIENKTETISTEKLENKTPLNEDMLTYKSDKYTSEENVHKLTKSQKNWMVGIVILIVIIIIGYIGSNNSSSDSLYYVNTTTYVATSKSAFDEMFDYINDRDDQALSTLMFAGKMRSLSVGTEVYLVSSHISYCTVRLKGSTQSLWIVTEHITKK